MKTFKTLCIASLVLMIFNCSSDDDSGSQQQQQTTLQLLTSGKWYNESKTPGSYTACEKMGYIQFMTNGNMTIDSFDDGSGTCESLGAASATYTLTNNVNVTIVAGPDTISGTINAISQNELTFTSNGETLVFDKTEG